MISPGDTCSRAPVQYIRVLRSKGFRLLFVREFGNSIDVYNRERLRSRNDLTRWKSVDFSARIKADPKGW